MIWDQATPCATCPYRRDVPRAFWAKVEFDNLRSQDANELGGSVFGCHSFRTLPAEQHRPCAGWLVDQKRRGLPSIQLRIALLKPEAGELLERVNDGGAALYDSIEEMCEANYPARKRRKAG